MERRDNVYRISKARTLFFSLHDEDDFTGKYNPLNVEEPRPTLGSTNPGISLRGGFASQDQAYTRF